MKKKKVNKTEYERFSPTFDVGLNSIQVNQRKELDLTNRVNNKYSKSYLSIFTNNICTFFNLLGLICFVALICTGASFMKLTFIFFYIANTSIGIFQEIRAKRCVDKLSIVANKSVKVIRDGIVYELSPNEIVLDDVIMLGTGSQVPTDSIILVGEVEVNESLLTGESVPVKKKVGDTLFAGSFIVSGSTRVKAENVGAENYVEKLSAKAKQYKKPKSEIMASLKLIIKVIGFIIVPLATAFMLKSMLLSKTNLSTAILGASSVIVGMIPAGMFLLTSVALAVGIIKLARHNTLVQDLYSLEMLARVDTICFDKTGTITDGQMSVKELKYIDNTLGDANKIISSMIFALNDENHTSIALQKYFGKEAYFESSEILPFNSERKLSAVTFNNGYTYIYGAPEFVFNDVGYDKIKEQVNEYAKNGYRVLVLARSSDKITQNNAPKDSLPISLIIIEDNIREDAVDTVNWFKSNNVQIKVISGDNPITVSQVAKRVGIENADKFVSLENLTDEEVLKIADEYTVFGRVNPDQKALLVKAMRNAGHVVAMTGDGVNDILAMKESDCAVSVASGSEAAKNVSHLVLLDNNFNSMPKVVNEGRRVINNVQNSASLFLMKTLFTMIMSIIMFCLPYMQTYPFYTSQMLVLEFFIIGIPAFFISLQPNNSRIEGKFIKQVILKSIPGALLMIFNVVVFEITKKLLPSANVTIITSLEVYSILVAGVFNLLFVCKPFNKYRTILFTTTAVIVLSIVVFALIKGITFLDFASLSPLNHNNMILLYTLLGIIIINLPLGLFLQYVFNKKIKK